MEKLFPLSWRHPSLVGEWQKFNQTFGPISIVLAQTKGANLLIKLDFLH